VELTWLYLAVALLSAVAALFLHRAVKGRAARLRVGAWLAIVVGISFFLIYLTKVDRDIFLLALALVCPLTGAHALEVERLHDHIRRLEDEGRITRLSPHPEQAVPAAGVEQGPRFQGDALTT
jgi:hypothetical protein